MKILVKESQFKVLLEQTNNSGRILNVYNQIVKASMGVGTDPDAILKSLNDIANINEFSKLLTYFKDGKTGYRSFEEMVNQEYERDNYDDIISLINKLNYFGIKATFNKGVSYGGQNLFMGRFMLGYGKDKKLLTIVGSGCKTKYQPLLKQAKDYWIKWLSSPTTKQKFKNNWKVGKDNMIDGKSVDDLFKQYISSMTKLKLVFYDNTMSRAPIKEYINLSDLKDAYAFVTSRTPENVYVNCTLTDDDPLGTMVHEIQHLLYNIKPLNPDVNIGNVFLKRGDKKMGPVDSFAKSTENLNKRNKDIDANSKILGVDNGTILSWANTLDNELESDDPDYICRETEKMSNIQSIRRLLGIGPNQNITPAMLKPYISGDKEHTDMYWILLCWASRGFKDLNLFLSDINKLAIQDTKPTDNTRLA
jgi:hypothetical protein